MTTIRTSPSRGPGSPEVTGFYHADTGSVQYLCIDPGTNAAALIDVALDFDPRSAATATDAADEILAHAEERGARISWILDTHPHADHVMAQAHLHDRTGAPTGIGARVAQIAGLWREFYHLPDAFDPEGDFDRLFAHGDTFPLGDLQGRVMLSPGHTLGSVTYVIGDAAFVHDTFMQPDAGTARADFPGGSAETLYDSLMAILDLPDETRLFVGHDYGGKGRTQPAWEATVAEHRRDNVHVGGGVARADYVALRERRDATLPLPDRMLAALQLNLRGGRLPAAEADGHRYLKIPLNRF